MSYIRLTDRWFLMDAIASEADAGTAIQTAVNDLPGTGGIIDCTRITNNVNLATAPFLVPGDGGVTTKQILWITGNNEYTVKTHVLLPSHFRLDARGTRFKRAQTFIPPDLEPGIFQTVKRRPKGSIQAGNRRVTLSDMTGVEPGCVIAIKNAGPIAVKIEPPLKRVEVQTWLVTVIDTIVSLESKLVDVRHAASVTVSSVDTFIGARNVVLGGSFTIDGQKGTNRDQTPWAAIAGHFAAGLVLSENARIEKCENGVYLHAARECNIDGNFYDNGRYDPDRDERNGAHVWLFGQCRGNVVRGWYRDGSTAIAVDDRTSGDTWFDGQGRDSVLRPYVIDHVPIGIHIEGNQLNHNVDTGTIKNILKTGIELSAPTVQQPWGLPKNCMIRTGSITLSDETGNAAKLKVHFTPDVAGGGNVLYTREPASGLDADLLRISKGNYGYSGDLMCTDGEDPGWRRV